MTYRMTQQRRQTIVNSALDQAAKIEGKSKVRCLNEHDVNALIDACRSHKGPVEEARAYADGGDFVPNSYRGRAEITVCEVGPYGLPYVFRVGAHRSRAEGPWVTVNNRRAK